MKPLFNKKKFWIVLVVVLLLCIGLMQTAFATEQDDAEDENLSFYVGKPEYRIEDGLAIENATNTLVSCRSDAQAVIIPAGVEVISSTAFRDCNQLQSVIVSEGVKKIDPGAFINCGAIGSINLPTTLDTIGHMTFYKCNLDTLIIPRNTRLQPNLGQSEWYGVLDACRVKTLVFCGTDGLFLPTTFGNIKFPVDGSGRIVFWGNPPEYIDVSGLQFNYKGGEVESGTFTICYPKQFVDAWAPNGETEWNGIPIRALTWSEEQKLIQKAPKLFSDEDRTDVTEDPGWSFDQYHNVTIYSEEGWYRYCIANWGMEINDLRFAEGVRFILEYFNADSDESMYPGPSEITMKRLILPESLVKANLDHMILQEIVITEGNTDFRMEDGKLIDIDREEIIWPTDSVEANSSGNIADLSESIPAETQLAPSFALAERDVEQGDGWIYQDGILTITANGGMRNYFHDQENRNNANKYQHEPYEVDCVVLGKDVTEFSMFVFGTDFYPTQMIVEEGNPNFAVIDGWLVNLKTKTLVCATDLKRFLWNSVAKDIPDLVESIGTRAFYPLNYILQIRLNEGLVEIEDWAFDDCGALQTMQLPSSVTTIGEHAFSYCHTLEKVVLGTNVDSIGSYAFDSCYNLEEINLEDTYITVLSQNVLSISGLNEIVLPDTLKTIEHEAFYLCTMLETVTVCSDDIAIQNGAFGLCDSLKQIIFTMGPPKSVGSRLFYELEKTPDGMHYLSSSYEHNREIIPYPTLCYTAAYAQEWAPNGETYWNGYPIRQLSKLETLSLPVRSTGATIVQASGLEEYETGDGWVYQNGTLRITADGGLEDFTQNELDENFEWTHRHLPDEVNTLVIGKQVTQIAPVASYQFWYFIPGEIRIESGSPYFVRDNGWIIQKQTGTLVGPERQQDYKGEPIILRFPDYVRAIGESAFDLYFFPYYIDAEEKIRIENVEFPGGLLVIGDNAFRYGAWLEGLDLPRNLTTIGSGAFEGCSNLEQVNLGSAVRLIGANAFYDCRKLATINLGDTRITALRKGVFGESDSLTTLTLPDTLQTIETGAFEASALKTLVINSAHVSIQAGAFQNCIALQHIIFTKGIPSAFGKSLFGESEKSPDGRYFISKYSWSRLQPIPYPTLFYTAAYADEWAPNGETEWNGYPIEEISQDELNAILAEARGEPAPAVSALVTSAPVKTAKPASDAAAIAAAPLGEALFVALMMAIVAGIVVTLVLARQQRDDSLTGESKRERGDQIQS